MSDINKRIEEAEDLISELKAQKRRQLEEEKAKHKPIYKYTIKKSEYGRKDIFNYLYDDSSCIYNIARECTNRIEARAAGHSEWDISTCGMEYAFNKSSGKLICSIGGGTLLLPNDVNIWEAVSNFIVSNPNGGDISSIMMK